MPRSRRCGRRRPPWRPLRLSSPGSLRAWWRCSRRARGRRESLRMPRRATARCRRRPAAPSSRRPRREPPSRSRRTPRARRRCPRARRRPPRSRGFASGAICRRRGAGHGWGVPRGSAMRRAASPDAVHGSAERSSSARTRVSLATGRTVQPRLLRRLCMPSACGGSLVRRHSVSGHRCTGVTGRTTNP